MVIAGMMHIEDKRMVFIGITGGVGAGKSAILEYLASQPNIRVMLADNIAHELMKPGTECYDQIHEQFVEEPIWSDDGTIDRAAFANVIFQNDSKRDMLNNIVHPAVKDYVIEQKNKAEKEGLSILVLEAALLIEEKYDEICDELWYIYTSKENRRKRLKVTRGYSDEKIDDIFASQLSENEYRQSCQMVIDNNADIDTTISVVKDLISKYKE